MCALIELLAHPMHFKLVLLKKDEPGKKKHPRFYCMDVCVVGESAGGNQAYDLNSL